VRVFVCGCRVQFYLFLSDVFAPKKPQQKLWSFLASRRTKIKRQISFIVTRGRRGFNTFSKKSK
jgi:hypothetical protein